MELETLQAVLPDIENRGASLVVISPQLEKYSKQVSKKSNLTYPVLCDFQNKVASEFGLVFGLPDDLKQIYQNFGIVLERFNGENTWQLPMPGRFIADPGGWIIDAEINTDYTVRPEPEEIIKILDNIQ
ncbi:MAG: hypothetical protein D3926_20015 [Desulfobacteraceae bacterium]|nr:MAG: hypothetical protein D3926_20015 [Desulfobacteraceae bacterium]